MIRTWVCETYTDDPDGEKGLNDKTLRKVPTPLFGTRASELARARSVVARSR